MTNYLQDLNALTDELNEQLDSVAEQIYQSGFGIVQRHIELEGGGSLGWHKLNKGFDLAYLSHQGGDWMPLHAAPRGVRIKAASQLKALGERIKECYHEEKARVEAAIHEAEEFQKVWGKV